MKPIRISSCYKCKPEVWEVIGESVKGIYGCDKCKKQTVKILRRKGE